MGTIAKGFIIGHAAAEPEARQLKNGTPVANFTLYTNRRSKTKEQSQASRHTIAAYGQAAEYAAAYIKKGTLAFASGDLVVEQWENQEGEKRQQHKIHADQVSVLRQPPEAENQNEPDV